MESVILAIRPEDAAFPSPEMSMDKTTTENIKELYDQVQFGYLNYDRARHNPLLFDQVSQLGQNQRLYDIGCGNGYWMERYVESGLRKDQIIGVDLSPRNVEHLNAEGFQALCGDVLQLGLPDEVSDLTVCNGVIHHTVDPFRAFKELVRITRPGGTIYLSVYNIWNPYYYLVHKMTFPFRFLYWRGHKWVADAMYPVARLFFQIPIFLLVGRLLDDRSGRTLFLDQVMTPRAHLYSQRKVRRYAERCGCRVEKCLFTNAFFMVTAVICKPDAR